jgi:hypothetical protein
MLGDILSRKTMQREDFRTIDIDGFVRFLRERGRKRRSFSHYTTLDSAHKIICSKRNYFFLSRGNLKTMNDQQEIQVGPAKEWDKTFIGSFSWALGENMAMWALYGIPWHEAVRITIPRNAMTEWMEGLKDGTYQICPVIDNHVVESRITPFDIAINDVAYILSNQRESTSNILYLDKTPFPLFDNNRNLWNIRESMEAVGYIKSKAWEYEQEVRIRLRTSSSTPKYEKIALELPDSVVASITLTTGPNFAKCESKLLKKIETKLTQVNAKVKIKKQSDFVGLVQYRALCSFCKHEPFVPK